MLLFIRNLSASCTQSSASQKVFSYHNIDYYYYSVDEIIFFNTKVNKLKL